MRNKETKDAIIYHCPKCGKICKGPASRRKHIQRGMCKVAKTVPCTGCARKFKTVKRRDLHFSHHHNPEARVWECPQCAKQTSSYSSYLNHQKWHRGYNSKVRQIKAREKHREQAQLKAYAKLLERRKPKSPRQGDPDYVNPAAKSAPAKIRCSPRIQREKEKSKGKKKIGFQRKRVKKNCKTAHSLQKTANSLKTYALFFDANLLFSGFIPVYCCITALFWLDL